MVKADEFVKCEDENEKTIKEKWTYFEELQKKVEILQDAVDEVVRILRENNIKRTEEIDAQYFDEDRLYTELEEDSEKRN